MLQGKNITIWCETAIIGFGAINTPVRMKEDRGSFIRVTCTQRK